MSADEGARLVALARRWIGTPYHHGAACRGAGCDCLGLIRGLWRELHGQEPEIVPPYSPGGLDQCGEALQAALSRHMRALAPGGEGAGTVLLFRLRVRAAAMHVGLLARPGPAARFIHAWEGRGVVESPLSAPWARRVVARFAMV